MRKALDRLYDAAAALAALFMVGLLAMVLLSVVGRQFHFYVAGTDAYAGYLMAGAGFLALAHTLKRGEHIRVTLLLSHLGARAGRAVEIGCHAAAVLLSGALAWFSVRLVWQSRSFGDVSQGMDATPLWIPQIAMALGTVLLFIAFADDLFAYLRGENPALRHAASGPAHTE